MSEEEIVLKRLKDTLAVLTGKNVITNLDFQIRNMVEDCIKVIEKQQEQLQEKDKIIDLMAKKINEAYFEENDFALWYEKYICEVQEKEDYSYLEPIIIEYFTKKAREV